MSRVGKYPVTLPSGVTAEMKGQILSVKGKNGTLETEIAPEVDVKIEPSQMTFTPINATKKARSLWGTARANAQNLVKGVNEGFSKTLEIEGVGLKAAVTGSNVILNLGFSHEIKYPIPAGITVKAEKPTLLVVSGIDRQRVGQVAAEIRSMKQPEPYKGKGIRYQGEFILRKEGKKK